MASGPERRQAVGEITHTTIMSLATSLHPRLPRLADVHQVATPLLKGARGPSRTGAQADIVTGVALYLRNCWPPASWRLIETEPQAPRRNGWRADLWWMTPSGMIADEIKTARRVTTGTRTQVDRELEAGLTRWGDVIFGGRLIVLGTVAASLWCTPDGLTLPLPLSPFWFDNPLSR